MSKERRKLIISILRIAVCAVFITLAIRGVTIHDTVTLMPGALPDAEQDVALRLVTADNTTVTVIQPDGTRRTFSRQQVARNTDGSERIERGLITAVRQCDARYLALALLIFAPVPFMQSWRFQIVLRAQDIRLSYWECVKLSFGGNFLNFVFMIGSTAGDVFKAYYTAMHTSRKTEAVTTILFDRVIGLTGLMIMAGMMIPLGSDDPQLRRLGLGIALVLAVVLVGAWVIGSAWVSTLASRPFFSKLPGWSHVKRAHGASERLIRQKTMILGAVLLTVLLQFVGVGAAVSCAYALGMDFSGSKVWDYFAYISSGHLIAAIPVAPMGFGTMEFAYKAFFLDRYGTLSQLLCLALWVRLLMLFWALPGGLVTLTGGYRPSKTKAPLPGA